MGSLQDFRALYGIELTNILTPLRVPFKKPVRSFGNYDGSFTGSFAEPIGNFYGFTLKPFWAPCGIPLALALGPSSAAFKSPCGLLMGFPLAIVLDPLCVSFKSPLASPLSSL